MVRRIGVAITLAFLASIPANAGQVIVDNFEGAQPNPTNWFVCNRDENEFRIEDVESGSFRALRTTVRARDEIQMFSLMLSHPECHVDDDPKDKYERAEIWEADLQEQPLGTDVWYQFSMYVDSLVDRRTKRLVIGQWKQGMDDRIGDFSPIVAQRFSGHEFSITIEQDNESAGHDPKDVSCRIIVAPKPSSFEIMSDLTDKSSQALLSFFAKSSSIRSLGHDNDGVSHSKTGAGAADPRCDSGVTVEPHADLPDPFGHWVTMRYHLKASTTDGLLEVWADGKPIVTVRGRIGYRTKDKAARQYFKFGPYRNREGFAETYALLAKYARASTAGELP